MEAYKSGLLAMKSALDELPLNKEEVEDVIDQMQDVRSVYFMYSCISLNNQCSM